MTGGSLSLAVAGRSLAQIFRKRGRAAFHARMSTIAPAAPPVEIWGYTKGGTLAASTNCFPAEMRIGQSYWWNMATDRPSADFAAGLDTLGPAGRRCDCLLWDLGQSEAQPIGGGFGRNRDLATADFRFAVRRCLDRLRARIAPDAPEQLPILLMPHAPHRNDATRSGGQHRVRAAQHALIAEIPNCHDAGTVDGMEMQDGVHPSQAGVDRYAAHVADAFARLVLGIAPPPAVEPIRAAVEREPASVPQAGR